jgi:hypothetical protein
MSCNHSGIYLATDPRLELLTEFGKAHEPPQEIFLGNGDLEIAPRKTGDTQFDWGASSIGK